MLFDIIEPIFWIKFFLVLIIFVLLLVVFNALMRRWLKVEKKRLFSYNHINQQHKKIDWTIRITFIAIFLFGYFYNISAEPYERVWFLEIWILMFIFIMVSQTVQAIMEWKYAGNRKAYILTISELLFIGILLISMFSTNVFGLF
ncbi:DUF4181 domain-containing protein [Virgibacillus sp. C22-A2]|uniref:DUF4181 domain-containing protein n=1 Tax=Virgibacillus tibetensis TaxID=3042313 RepID=A0ABU6KCA3_9BACI|nr:DUF4181 domain-containing protein [Virgibacillus sp. C22-A2]